MRAAVLRAALLCASLQVAGCFQRDTDIAAYLDRARQYAQSGDVANSRKELLQAVKLKPADPQANYALAQAEEQAGNTQAAIAYYARAAVPEGRLLPAQLRFEEILIDSDRYQDALGRINFTLGAFPNNPDALALKADIEQRQGDLKSARDDAAAALRGDGKNARALAVLALLELGSKGASGAMDLINRGLKDHPDDFRLLQVQAALMLTANQPEKAADALRTIVHSQPTNVSAQKALAELESRNGHFDQAVESFEAAAKADPSNQDMQLAFVTFLAGQQKMDDVIRYVQSLIAKYPANYVYDLALAQTYAGQEKWPQAEAVLKSAYMRLGDNDGGRAARTVLAEVESRQGRIAAAQADLDAVLKADPRNERALLLQSFLQLQNGRGDLAVNNLLDLLRINPVSGRAYQQLANAYLLQGDARSATDAMRRAVAVLPGDDAAQVDLAAFLQKVGRTDESREIMARLTLARPNNPYVWLANGQLAILRKDWDGVTRSIARLRDLPDATAKRVVLEARASLAKGNASQAVQSFRALIDGGQGLEPGIFGEFAKASVDADQALASATFLEGKASSLPSGLQSQAWAAVMTLFAEGHDFAKALVAFDKARSLTPLDPDLYKTAAKIFVLQGQAAKAKAVVQTGLSAGAPGWAMLMVDGAINNAQGDIPAARQDYAAALKENPYSLEALNNYASTLADSDPKNTQALSDVRAQMTGLESSVNPSIVDTIAWVDYRLGRIDEAKQLLQKINAAQSGSPQIRFHLGAVLMASGERAEGLALLNGVKDLTFPGSQEAQSLAAS